MKTRLTHKARQAASALLTTLVICSILSIFVMYYLSLIDQQSFLSARSQTWNLAITVTEAGVEDGMQHLNSNYPNLGVDGWSATGTGGYMRSNTLPGGNSYVAYVFITNAVNPVVVCRSYVTPPSNYAQNRSPSLFASVSTGQAQTTAATSTTVSRAVQATCSKMGLFNAAMVAKNNIDLNGNGITTDSFDSTNPARSTNGQYDPAKYTGDKGDVATNLGVVDSLNAGNANIYGIAHTGPNSASTAVAIGPNGGIGTHAWQTSNKGIQPGHWVPDSNFTFPNTDLPSTSSGYVPPTSGIVISVATVTSSTAPAAGTYVGSLQTTVAKNKTTYTYGVLTTNNYTQIFGSANGTSSGGKYVVDSIASSAIVTDPNVTIVVRNGMNMGSSDQFVLTKAYSELPSGVTPLQDASVTVYSGGTSCAISGNGVLNQPGIAGNFILLCAPTVTSFALNGNAGFTGVLVAPSVALSMNGGGNNTIDFIGSVMANSITMNGHFNFHYDEGLLSNKNFGRFLITAWNEVK